MKKLLALCFMILVGGCGGGSDAPDQPQPQDVQDSRTNCHPPAARRGNICVTPTPPAPSCTAPKVLQNGVCVTPVPTCTAPKVLQNGVCVTPTPVPPTCTPPQVLQGGVCVTPTPVPPTVTGPSGQDAAAWTMTFSDEFEATTLDLSKWNLSLWYEGSDPTQNWAVENGSLKIWPQRNASGAFVNRHLTTDAKFQQTYGYYEIEAKLPYGKGSWPAFWLYAHPCDSGTKCRPEIDIMEAYSGGGANAGWSTTDLKPNNYGLTIHKANADYSYHEVAYATKMRDFAPYSSAPIDLSAGWHKYGMKWDSSGVTFYFDGQQIGPKWTDTAAYFDQPMYVLLSFQLGSASGVPDATTPTGKTNSFDVKYVRVWKAK